MNFKTRYNNRASWLIGMIQRNTVSENDSAKPSKKEADKSDDPTPIKRRRPTKKPDDPGRLSFTT